MHAPARQIQGSVRSFVALAFNFIHCIWLVEQAENLLPFERRTINPLSVFHDLDDERRPKAPGYGAPDKPTR
jgi:hypothetical protein